MNQASRVHDVADRAEAALRESFEYIVPCDEVEIAPDVYKVLSQRFMHLEMVKRSGVMGSAVIFRFVDF